ncbi:hypothetical protein GCM10007276_29550 [Agaricicola taiwanensis]|uniref:Uncharacterized protein n=1 Tax=Agaricicola taiwanensis TaxID=591372 RepID=A0A8J2YLA8_9RHOB|nr:hypothetical protein [Agaricicola taiwanensis]GGE50566.1 hypothetical protein GCM10007276_29550 [Agaricicola taiwanensis]
MQALNMVLTSAVVATGFLVVDTIPLPSADAAVAGQGQMINRAGKSDRLTPSAQGLTDGVSVRIETDSERGTTKVIRHAPEQTRSTGETDFAYLLQ